MPKENYKTSKYPQTLIIGCGGLAKQALSLIKLRCNDLLFYDDQDFSKNDFYGHKVVHALPKEEMDCVICVSNPQKRKHLEDFVVKNNKKLINIYPPEIEKDLFNNIQNAIILEGSKIELGVRISNGVLINKDVTIHHDCKIGKYCVFAPGCRILGNVSIDDFSFIGANSVIREKTRIGKNSIIGMGTILISDVEDQKIYVGNPGRLLKDNWLI